MREWGGGRGPTERDGGSLRILAVDDSSSARKLFQGVLLRLGVGLPDLRFASTASEALQLFTQWRPDLVFVDIDLHGGPRLAEPEGAAGPPLPVDGDDLARQMMQRNPQLNVVVVTAYDRDNPRVRTLLADGAADVIVKPLLAARVKEVLERFSPARGPERRRGSR